MKIPVILVIYYWNLNCLDRFLTNTHISNFMKIRPVGADLFHADGQTDRHMNSHIDGHEELTVAFCCFSHTPNKVASPFVYSWARGNNCMHRIDENPFVCSLQNLYFEVQSSQP
jgi:hypothetical protein